MHSKFRALLCRGRCLRSVRLGASRVRAGATHPRRRRFAGRVSQEQIGAFYDRADIFINASIVDNMPVSVLEAFVAGLPVVSTAPGGIRYIVEHERTGLLSPPHEWRQLGESV